MSTTPFNIMTRARWGAEPPLTKEPIKHPIPYIRLIPLSTADPCFTEEECITQMKKIQHHDMYDGKQQDIIPNFLIGDDGKVYEGRGWFSAPPDNQVPTHFSGKYLLIAHIGGSPTERPSPKVTEARNNLVQYGSKRKFIMDPHSVI